MPVFEDQDLENNATKVVEKVIHSDAFDKSLPEPQMQHVEESEKKA